jgi:signal peptidase II
MTLFKRLLLIVVVLVSCIGCDQATKAYAETNLPKAQALSFLSGTVRLQVAHNEGAFLSAGANWPKSWRLAALRVGVGAMLVALLAYAVFFSPAGWPGVFALALILAGGVSNLIDRLLNDGYVVDFIHVGVGPLHTGIFNVADIALTAGVLMLLAQSWGLSSRGHSRSGQRG